MALTMTVSTIANAAQQDAFEYVSDLSHHPDWAMDQMTIEPVTPVPLGVGAASSSTRAPSLSWAAAYTI